MYYFIKISFLVCLMFVAWRLFVIHPTENKLKSDENLFQYTATRQVTIYTCENTHANKKLVLEWVIGSFAQFVNMELKFETIKDEITNYNGFTFILVSKHTGEPKCTYSKIANDKNIFRVAVAGEVFNNRATCGDKVDFIIDRTRERKIKCKKCKLVHYIQGLQFSKRKDSKNYDTESLCFQGNNNVKRNNTALLATTRLIKRSFHPADALVRGVLFSILGDIYGFDKVHGTSFLQDVVGNESYTRVKCSGNELDIVDCKRKYKFSIDMENTSQKGYISEKIFTGLIAGTIPIYFGAPDIENYVNPDRFIHCKLPYDTIELLRSKKQHRYFTFEKNRLEPSDDELLKQAKHFLKPHLHNCINKIEEVDKNNTLYEHMLKQTPIKDCKKSFYQYSGRQLYNYIYT